jgi:hypothetical protein
MLVRISTYTSKFERNEIIPQKLIVTYLFKDIPSPFMKSEVSLPSSQDGATGPHLEPAESSPRFQTVGYFLIIRFNMFLPSTARSLAGLPVFDSWWGKAIFL